MREISTFKNSEHIVHYVNYNHSVYNSGGGSGFQSESANIVMILGLGIVTNYSNLIWLERLDWIGVKLVKTVLKWLTKNIT